MSAQQMLLGAGTSGVTLLFTDHATDFTQNQAVYTYTSRAISTAAANRQVVVSVSAPRFTPGTRNVNSMTIGGISASFVARQNSSNGDTTEQWAVSVPSGTTATIVVTFNANMGGCGIGVWAMYGAQSSASATAGSIANPMSVSINVPAGGCAIGSLVDSQSNTWTWTGITKRFDEFVNATVSNQSGASDQFGAAQTGLSITATPSLTPSDNAMIVTAWAPGP